MEKRIRKDLMVSPKDKLIEAIKAGEKEEALKYVEELAEDSHVVHDRMLEWSQTLFTYIGNKVGEEAVLEATNALVEDVLGDKYEKLSKASPEQIVKWFARTHRTHYSKYYIEEDDEKFTIVVPECGSTGRIMKEGMLDTSPRSPVNFGTTKKPYPWAFNLVGMPWYCVHACVQNDLYKKLGLKVETGFGFQFDKDGNPIDDPCWIYVYKDGSHPKK